ncbi:hydrogen gas-evolving membrane-bound hydrogenase subunit E [Halocalculus aciditolerans]|uniref:Cation:proton antiporter n=1 Tax=Halocalculus aciditolerans TaxID=1383812 RepID=A0A830FAZ4_9EURY|nr:hydrogen gas-evolving membrane-bound hydrogenase subunit E [Halocalculus aciditolerans]GGL56579.1 cation:proton antiporter [Halocalculus aciditolerans]
MYPTPRFAVVLALVALPFVAAAVAPAVYRRFGDRTGYFAAGVAGVCFALVVALSGTQGATSVPWVPTLGISLSFYVDSLAVLVGYLASGVGVLVFLYSVGYMADHHGAGKYYATMLAFMGSMLGVVFAGDLVALFLFWEMTSLCSFLLVGHDSDDREARRSARKAFVVTVGGGLFLLLAIILVSVGVGTTSVAELLADPAGTRAALESAGLLLPVTGLVAVGAGAKSAQVPLHIWLPDAMAAPTPVSAFLHSATMVKAGVFLFGRLRPVLDTGEWGFWIAALGLTTMCVTALLAVAADELKELLAYSTASHLGLLTAGFGFTSLLGAETGAFQFIAHATFKAPLFLVAGIVMHAAHTQELDELSGVRHALPVTALVAVIAGLGMGGIPPFNGFYAKEFLFEAAWEAAVHDGGVYWLFPVLAVVGSIFTFVYAIRFVAVFFGDTTPALDDVHAPGASMLVPVVVLGGIALAIGLGGVSAALGAPPTHFNHFVGDIATAVGGGGEGGHGHAFSYYIPTHLTPAVGMSAIAIGAGALLYPYRDRIGAAVDAVTSTPGLAANWWYRFLLDGAANVSFRADELVDPRRIRSYATAFLATAIAVTALGYTVTGGVLPRALSAFTVTLDPELAIVFLVAVVATAGAIQADSHLAGVLALSVLGFMVAIFFVVANAPDVALTQIVVETLVFVVFLLVLSELPEYYGEISSSRATRDGLLAVLVGALVTTSALAATYRQPDTIAGYFAEHAVPDGGGHNIVNVILVDFRGLDTLGEISVIAMAGLAVLTVVAMRERGEAQ